MRMYETAGMHMCMWTPQVHMHWSGSHPKGLAAMRTYMLHMHMLPGYMRTYVLHMHMLTGYMHGMCIPAVPTCMYMCIPAVSTCTGA